MPNNGGRTSGNCCSDRSDRSDQQVDGPGKKSKSLRDLARVWESEAAGDVALENHTNDFPRYEYNRIGTAFLDRTAPNPVGTGRSGRNMSSDQRLNRSDRSEFK